jgi:hypothetical protein
MSDTILQKILAGKLYEAKQEVLKEMQELLDNLYVEEEEQVLEEGRFKIVRVRIRKGKVQRRKKVSTIKGYTIRKGRLTRMSTMEKRNRKIGARRGKIKRRAKKAKALMNRKRSIRKLKAVGGMRKR